MVNTMWDERSKGCDIACCIKRPANAPRILDTTIASCKENSQSRVNKTQRVDSLELFPKKIKDPLFFFRYPLT